MAYSCDDIYESALLFTDAFVTLSTTTTESATLGTVVYQSAYSFADETASITSSSDINRAAYLTEVALLSSDITSSVRFTGTLVESASVLGNVLTQFSTQVVEQATVGGVASDTIHAVLTETAYITSVVGQATRATTVVTETAKLSGGVITTNDAVLFSTGTLRSVVFQASRAQDIAFEVGSLASELIYDVGLSDLVVDFATIVSEVQHSLFANWEFDERAYLSSAASPNGYSAWVSHVYQMAMSRFVDLNSAEVVTVGRKSIGVSPKGVYELTRSPNVYAYLLTGKSDMSNNQMKRMSDFFSEGEADSPLELTVYVDDNGVDAEYSYPFQPRTNESTRANRSVVGKGLRSRHWQFKVANPSGEHFALRKASAPFSVTGRRL